MAAAHISKMFCRSPKVVRFGERRLEFHSNFFHWFRESGQAFSTYPFGESTTTWQALRAGRFPMDSGEDVMGKNDLDGLL